MWWQVSDGLLYNYFEDKEDLLASALLARRCGHVCDAAVARARHRYGGRSMSTRFAEWEKPSEGIYTSRPHWQQRTAQAHRRLTKLDIPSRLTIDDFGHSTESGRR